MRRMLTTLVLILAITGCTTDRLLRPQTAPPVSEIDLERQARLPLAIERYSTFTLGVIELSDTGEPRDVAQKEAVLDEVDTLGRKGTLTLVVFVHGWHHDAEVGDTNLDSFREILRKLAAPESNVRPPIMGVYLAWRGETFKGRWSKNWVTNLSFWNREAEAHHIGARGGELVLRELNTRASNLRRAGTRTTMVTVGHSFGALLVLTAVAAEMVDYKYCENKPFCWPPMREDPGHAFGDLVVLINPAVEAERFVPFDIYSRQIRRAGDGVPTSILVLASDGDLALKLAFPIGRFIAAFPRPLRTWAWRVEHEALGVYPRQLTHRLAFAADQVAGDCQQQTTALKLCRLPGTGTGNAPFVVARAPRALIPGHSAIYDSRLQAFLVRYIAASAQNAGWGSTSD